MEVRKQVMMQNPPNLDKAMLMATRCDTVVYSLAKGHTQSQPMDLGQASGSKKRSKTPTK